VAHPFNPVYLLPINEIVPGEKTGKAFVERAREAYSSIGMKCVVINKEIDAFVGNRLLEAAWREALWLIKDGVCTVEELDDIMRYGFGLRWAQMGMFQTYLYYCQEDFSDGWNTIEKFAQTLAAEGDFGPLFQAALVEGYGGFFEACELFDKHPREGWTDIGSTDVPVLSMNGELDNQTAGIWGELAVQNFTNATLVLVPESGHGTIRFSQCAKDITAAYLEDPGADLDTSCVEDLRLPVMLPDGTMHPLPY
jgi:hypothetical protein